MGAKNGFGGMVGRSPQMQELFELITCVAEDGESTVLIQGQSGTGKELIARAIHDKSERKSAHFVPVNCAAIPDELLESELFGYVKGAFTGAQQAKIGRVQFADGGTLFLDEIGDMKPNLQAKLLRVLQEREVEPVGGIKPIKVDVRVIAATHQNLEELVASGTFREDLYYRLAVIPLVAPPLCDRQNDIVLLAEKFIDQFSRRRSDQTTTIDPVVMKNLQAYSWPGNVRELENLMQRMAILHRGKRITLKELPEKYRCLNTVVVEDVALEVITEGSISLSSPTVEWSADGLDFNRLISELEDRLILQALSQSGGNKKEAARMLNLKRTTLIEKIKKKNLEG